MNNKNHNKTLDKYKKLLGTWELTGSHRLMPGIKLSGICIIYWLQEGGLVTMKTIMNQKEIPELFAVFGHDDKNDPEKDTMLYFDERGVSRIFEVYLNDQEWRYWRNAPHFSQRFTGTFQDGGNTIVGLSELCEDDITWKRDLELIFVRK
ncbi:MAG: hypothetical protein KW802_00950 [Candidatus Doudnabacteria bacterium]|nr:hypothetical protein [Candidatus Doudnabacteria bacterium]